MTSPLARFVSALGRLQNKLDRLARNRRYRKSLRALPALESVCSAGLLSVILPVCDPPLGFLQRAVSSVLSQDYRNLELCICDDGSASPEVRAFLDRLKAQHPQVKLHRHPSRQGIARAGNTALELAAGAWVLFLDHDDELVPGAASHLAKWLSEHPSAEVIYSDEDKINETGRAFNPFFKPDYSPHLLLGCNYVGHLLAVRRDSIERMGRFRPGFEGAQDYDLLLRLSRAIGRFEHLPQVLYHWREWRGSTARDVKSKVEVGASTRKALLEHAAALGWTGLELQETGYPDRVRWRRPALSPEKTVLRLYGAGEPASIASGTSGQRVSLEGEEHSRVSLDHYTDPSFLEAIIARARESSADLLLYTNGALACLDSEKAEQLLALALEGRVGVAGGWVVDRRGRTCDAGANLARSGQIHFPFMNLLPGNPGYQMLATVESNVVAPCVHCFAAKRDLFVGLYENGMTYVELCLRIIAEGYFNVCRPSGRAVARGRVTRSISNRRAARIAPAGEFPVYLCDV